MKNTKDENRPLDPILPGRLRLGDAARRAELGRGMRGNIFKKKKDACRIRAIPPALIGCCPHRPN
jgi:hypothetical protein